MKNFGEKSISHILTDIVLSDISDVTNEFSIKPDFHIHYAMEKSSCKFCYRREIDQLTHFVYLFTKRPLKCAVRQREGKKSRRMAGPPSPPARKPRSVSSPSPPPGLAPFLLTSCQVRVAARRVATRPNGRRGRAMLLHRETPETDNSLKDLGQRWELRGPTHLFD
ncbi:hypothetical protein ALC56_14863 [Trachymyrmex septentrionalis]|uniref:Uncharacterized protein n=1 Tax=Trachymyrmex septentrionalis TaxID=34720 RepID=A0A195ESA3_9HYME|nr:hypothetical protein ALC56_14863 [Trachymyrmex septentrionalis]